jgi:hypothetical protein
MDIILKCGSNLKECLLLILSLHVIKLLFEGVAFHEFESFYIWCHDYTLVIKERHSKCDVFSLVKILIWLTLIWTFLWRSELFWLYKSLYICCHDYTLMIKERTPNVMCSPWSKSLYDLHWFELSFEGVSSLDYTSPYIFVVMIILLWSRKGHLMWCVLLGQNPYMVLTIIWVFLWRSGLS